MTFCSLTANRSNAVVRYRRIGMVRSANRGLRRVMSDSAPALPRAAPFDLLSRPLA
jgi:hypothetical protein